MSSNKALDTIQTWYETNTWKPLRYLEINEDDYNIKNTECILG